MSQNVEIKARFADLETGRQKAEALGARFSGRDRQIDTYFKVPNGRLKLRQSSLSGNFLIPYLRPNRRQARDSQYVLLPVNNAETTLQLLRQMFGVRLVVEKERDIFLWQNVRIHLDRVKHLGNFLEFEAVVDEAHSTQQCHEQVRFLMAHFGLAPGDLVDRSYVDLLEAQNVVE